MALLNKRFGSGFESGWLVVLPAVVGAYGAVVPILHGAHGRGDLAGASISWRLGLPVLGAMLGGEKVGIGGLFLAMALDASLAFWDAPKAGSPVVSITRDGVALGIRQTF